MKSLQQLLTQWEAGTLSVDEVAELKQRLASPEGRAELVREWLLDEAIYDTLRLQPSQAPAHAKVSLSEVGQTAAKSARAERRVLRWLSWREIHVSIRWPLGFAIASCLLLFGLNIYFQNSTIGSLAGMRGQVTVIRDGKKLNAVQGQPFYPGDRLIVSPGGNAIVAWEDESTRLEVATDSDLQVHNPMLGKRLRLHRGVIDATVASQSQWRPMIVSTPQAEAKVVGTQFSLSATGAVTRLAVWEGVVLFRKTRWNSGDVQKEVMVHSGEAANAAPGAKLETQFLTGFLSSDVWTVPPGTPLRSAPVQGTLIRPSPATVSNRNSGFVERLRGYLVSPATGDFTMWIAPFSGSAAAELWLSSDENPDHKRLIAFSRPAGTATSAPAPTSESNPGRRKAFGAALSADWGRSPNQKSNPQTLVQGRRYYLEVWHEGPDVSSLALGWILPGQPPNARPTMVDLQDLCPYFETTATLSRRNSP